MTDLSLTFRDIPPTVVGEILDVLENAQGSGAAASIVIFKVKGVFVGEVTVRDDEANLSAKVTALDAEGNETTFDEMPTWESSDLSVATVTPSEDGYSATFEIGSPGSAVITVTGIENSSGEDVEVKSVGTITVTAGDAVVGSVEFAVGAPQINPLDSEA